MGRYGQFLPRDPVTEAELVELVQGRTVRTLVAIGDLVASMAYRGAHPRPPFPDGPLEETRFSGWTGPHKGRAGRIIYERDGWRANRPLREIDNAGEGEV